jgi:hypothetical protein
MNLLIKIIKSLFARPAPQEPVGYTALRLVASDRAARREGDAA